MAATKQYTAIFAIGGKLLGSFRGAFAVAEARLRRLRSLGAAVGAGFRKIGALALAGFAGAFTGFAASKILGGLFEGAVEQAVEAEQRVRAISFSLLKLNQVRKQGLPFAKAQAQMITDNNEGLAKQGVLLDDIFNEMSKTLAMYGVPPKQIMQSVGALGDMLVATRGVTASEEEAAQLAGAVAKAIFRGQGRALLQYGVVIDKTWAKEHATYQSRLDSIMGMIKAYKGANKAAEATPIGRIQKFRNEMQKTREEIGFRMLPIQAELADKWRRMLPIMKEGAIRGLELMLAGVMRLSDFVERTAIPAVQRFVGHFSTLPEGAKSWQSFIGLTFGGDFIAAINTASLQWQHFVIDFKAGLRVVKDFDQAFQNFLGAEALRNDLLNFARNFVQAWKDLSANLKSFDDWFTPLMQKAGKALIDFLLTPIKDIKAAWDSTTNAFRHRPTWLGGQGATQAAPTAAAQAAAAQIPLTPAGARAVQAERAPIIAELQRPELRNLVSATLATEAQGAEDQKNVLEALVNRAAAQKRAGNYQGVEAMIKGGFYGPYNRGETAAVMSKGLSDARSLQVKEMIDQVAAGRNALGGLTDQGMINEIRGAIKEKHGEDYYGLLRPTDAQTEAFRQSRAYADGGIATKPQIATLAEKGPEIVLPFEQWVRRLGPSGYPLDPQGRAMAPTRAAYDAVFGRMRQGTPAPNVNFSPNITINGNATEEQQSALMDKMRDMSREFIKNFVAAQRQSRRLSYEGGYG